MKIYADILNKIENPDRLLKYGEQDLLCLLGFIGFVIGILMVVGCSYILAFNLDVILNTRITPKN